jgi:phytoene dehydrogenase-like protein
MSNRAERTTSSGEPGRHDAIVVGAGPNGLAAAITLARKGLSVLVLEAEATLGGGVRSAELTLPGFVHDLGSAVYPFVPASPFFRCLPLAEHGLELIQPPSPLAHPLADETAVLLERSVEETAQKLGDDAAAYRRLMGPAVAGAERIFDDLLRPLRVPSHPRATARFGLRCVRSARGLADTWFRTEPARALFAGLAAHAILPLEQPVTAGIALMLGLAGHAVGWPVPRGGAQRLTDALVSYLRALGGHIETNHRVQTLDELPPARAILLDLTPRQVLQVAGAHLPRFYRWRLGRYRYGPGVYKIDWALDGPIPWSSPACTRAGTIHLGGTFDEIAAAEAAVWRGEPPEKPFVLLAQPSLFDSTRAPEGRHTAWAYCHVPNGSNWDMSDRIEAQIERFAPGFRARVLARSILTPSDLQRRNANLIGGDITGGVQDLRQLFTRPVARWVPYTTPNRRVFLCSSSTPPGAGVHGLCGYFAAQAVLARVFS